ncbi:hypothetical protein F5Y03DRAFT_362494 [Xylaria venustula]|nr:hypothetical protein F5Y03DRAFT_362494 [Xylaria venustula]
MSQASLPPSPTLTAGNELGNSHEPSPMLEVYCSEEPSVAARLLMPGKRDPYKERLDAANRQINTFEQKWSKQK